MTCILLVEDDFMIAYDLKLQLEDAGFTVSGPAGRVDAALSLLKAGPVDAAILDMNLQGGDSFPVAEALDADGTPFLFLSGNDAAHLPEAFAGRTVHAKPVQIARLIDEIRMLTKA